MMCDCVNIDIGSYDNQRWVYAPTHMPKSNGYCLDNCIAEEVLKLWREGITTTGCCCGHNKVEPYIGVIDSDIEKMKAMGYQVQPNTLYPDRQDGFCPMTFNAGDQS
jgi:hypothetical protein